MISKEAAELETSALFNALASNDDGLLLVGAQRASNAEWQPTIWHSPDGLHWIQSTHPPADGVVFAVATDGDTALAVGGIGLGVSTFVWRSSDAGLTWTTAASGTSVFGTPAPEMGRPNVSGLVRYVGWTFRRLRRHLGLA